MATSTVDDLRRYFESFYREGGEFQSEEYEDSKDFDHCWKHLRTGIVVWKDAIDLSTRPGAKAYFHYTGELPFRNITALEKEAAEVWASLKTEGEGASAWWGRGVYSVPKSPDRWANQMEILDNNFRNMMRRDVALHGEEYVRRVYPPRASFCIPLLIDPENAYDISVRPTPEMEAAGKPPGTNLGGKLLNEPGQPERCCVVLRVVGEDGVTNARARLLDALRAREAAAQSPGLEIVAKARLGNALRKRGYFPESKILLTDVLETRERTLGAEHASTLASVNNLANCCSNMGQLKDAEALYRRALEAQERTLGAQSILTRWTQSTIWQFASETYGPAERCRSAPQESFGGQWAHPRCRASLHIGLSQQFGKLPPRHGPAERCRSTIQERFGGQWAHPRCGPSWHIGLSQQFGNLPQGQGPAERCRSALQESFGGPWAHPRCGASFHIGLSQHFGNLFQDQGPAERCRDALQESFGGPWAHPRCGASWHIGLSQQFGSLPQDQGPAERCRSAPQESFGGPWAHPRCGPSWHIGLTQQFGNLRQGEGKPL